MEAKKYLETRKDENPALFINYKSRNDSMNKGRLTARSVERIVNKHAKRAGFTFLITPETLRWSRAQLLSWFTGENKGIKKINYHGQEHHKKIMATISNYFRSKGNTVILEPILNYGRADLGVRSKNYSIFIEVGTVSLFKLWYNLSTMKNTTFLIIPFEDKILEFIPR